MAFLPDCMMPDGADPCRGYMELKEEETKLRRVALAAVACVQNHKWAGVCDEDVMLENVLREVGLI